MPALIGRLFQNHFVLFTTILLTFLGIYGCFYLVPFEDAAILFRYSENLAETRTIGFNPDIERSEGATDFLWMVVLAFFRTLGVEPFIAATGLSILTLILYLAFIKTGDAVLNALIILCIFSLPQVYAGFGGFSVIVVSVLFSLFAYSYFTRRFEIQNLYLALMLCLLRPDLLFFVALPVVLSLARVGNMKLYAWHLCLVITLGISYYLWRMNYFGMYFPLPFYVKSSQPRDYFIFFERSLIFVVPTLLLALFFAKLFSSTLLKSFLVLFVPAALCYSALSLDQNIGNRFMGPVMLSCFALLIYNAKNFGVMKARLLITAFFCMSLLVNARTTLGTVNQLAQSQFHSDVIIAMNLGESFMPSTQLLVTEAGRIPLYSGLVTHDLWGLNSSYFNRTPADIKVLRKIDWSVALAHCPIKIFLAERGSTEVLEKDKSRNWGAMCRRLRIHLDQRGADQYTIAFYKYTSNNVLSIVSSKLGLTDSGCGRFDILIIKKEVEEHLGELLRDVDHLFPADITAGQYGRRWDEICIAPSQIAKKDNKV